MEHATIIDHAIASIRPPDEAAREAARAAQLTLTKPAGSLGRLEELAIWAAGIARAPAPAFERKAIIVAAADHGVAADGVSAYPQDVTAQMLRNFLAGGAAINVLARAAHAGVRIVDAGVRGTLNDPRIHRAKLRDGTSSIAEGAGMRRDEAEALVARGIAYARGLRDEGIDAVGLGDMGIGNTTPAAAITSAITGADPRMTVGRGTGVDDETYARKLDAVQRALAINAPAPSDAIAVAATLGGCEIAFLAGLAVGAAANRIAVILDGYPTTAAALIAARLAPGCMPYMLASHRSAEPGHRIALDHLGLRPLLDLDMRLGEGTGAALAFTLIDAALRIPREMATFDSAGVSRSTSEIQPEA